MLKLEALNAEQGDCLLLHYGDDSSRGLLLVDGGPSGVYNHTLRERLMELRDELELEEDEPLPIDALVVSHIDDDHIHGVVDMSNELVRSFDHHAPLLFDVRRLWHNSFERSMTGITPGIGAHFDAGASPAEAIALAAQQPVHVSGSVVEMASVGQGATLRNNARRLNWRINGGFDNGLAMQGDGASVRNLNGLAMTVIESRAAELELLRQEWLSALESSRSKSTHEASVELSAFVDKSAANLSSIAMLAEYDGKTILFTGDARGDNILKGLRDAGLLTGDSLRVDVLKLPHHGSINNVGPGFFRQITAKHYVISANGDNGNPDIPTLRLLLAERTDDDFTLHVTNEIPHVTEFLRQARGQRRFRENVRRPQDSAITIDLA